MVHPILVSIFLKVSLNFCSVIYEISVLKQCSISLQLLILIFYSSSLEQNCSCYTTKLPWVAVVPVGAIRDYSVAFDSLIHSKRFLIFMGKE